MSSRFDGEDAAHHVWLGGQSDSNRISQITHIPSARKGVPQDSNLPIPVCDSTHKMRAKGLP